MALANRTPVNLPRDICDALTELERLNPGHELVIQYGRFIVECPSPQNGADQLLQFRPSDDILGDNDDPFEQAQVVFLSLIEDVLIELRSETENTSQKTPPKPETLYLTQEARV